MAEQANHLARVRRADTETKAARLLATLDAFIAAGQAPVVSGLARRAGVSRRFVYDHPELRAEIARRASELADHQAGAITASSRTTTASLRADLENAKAANRRRRGGPGHAGHRASAPPIRLPAICPPTSTRCPRAGSRPAAPATPVRYG